MHNGHAVRIWEILITDDLEEYFICLSRCTPAIVDKNEVLPEIHEPMTSEGITDF